MVSSKKEGGEEGRRTGRTGQDRTGQQAGQAVRCGRQFVAAAVLGRLGPILLGLDDHVFFNNIKSYVLKNVY